MYFSDLAQNLSEGGLGLETISRLAEGDELEIEFTLPGTEDGLCVRTRVVWVRPVEPEGHKFGAGLQFAELAEEERAVIRRFVSVEAVESQPEGDSA